MQVRFAGGLAAVLGVAVTAGAQEPKAVVIKHGGQALSVAWHPAGKLLATGGLDGESQGRELRLWNPATGR